MTPMKEISQLPKQAHSLFVNEQQNGDASALVSDEAYWPNTTPAVWDVKAFTKNHWGFLGVKYFTSPLFMIP